MAICLRWDGALAFVTAKFPRQALVALQKGESSIEDGSLFYSLPERVCPFSPVKWSCDKTFLGIYPFALSRIKIKPQCSPNLTLNEPEYAQLVEPMTLARAGSTAFAFCDWF
jgi:hypothetical protein